jgi:predicted Holliday junction resolvase-like endonuclease
MNDVVLIVLGIVLGVLITAYLSRGRDEVDREALREEIAGAFEARAEADRTRIARAYEAQIRDLKEKHRDAVLHARRSSTNHSRAVLKGKMAEQVAPLLPGFDYWPADARFLGDPVDYVVFNGYSACKDRQSDGRDLEVVILDIKRGKSVLTREQRRIADAVAAGRVRFEVVRVFGDGTLRTRAWEARASSPATDAEKTK